jgi:DNA-nicking Smr family endonuclease
MDKKKNKLPADEHLFQQAMDGVKPLKSPDRTDSKAPRVSARIGRQQPATFTPSQDSDLRNDEQLGIDTEDGASYRKNGVQKRIMQKLKRGRYQLGDQLDLHHMNTKTGAEALMGFIADSQAGSLECIRIIHGKGLRSEQGPRLKTMTRQLLREHPQVLAFTACKPADGGDGATDVLLKS